LTTRRQFLGTGAALLAAAKSVAATLPKPASEKLDILFLGGTGFIGPHQVNYALDRGHTVSMFNRGRRSDLYGDRVEQLIGNRDARIGDGLKALAGNRRWDVVVDNSGYVPRHVRDSAELLKGRCSRYLYTSTVAVYDFDASATVDNAGPLLAAPNPDTEAVTGETYGPLKAECDRIVQDVFGEQATIVRPTYIVGPGDSTDRFTYWVERFHRGGDVVCPANPEFEAQWIDVRDLCHWLVSLGETDTPGIFNGVGPASPVTIEALMYGLRAFSVAPTRLHWPSAEILGELDFPTPMFGGLEHSIHVDASAAVAAGLRYRSLVDTVRDTHGWWQSLPAERRNRAQRWPTPEQEAAVLGRLEPS
jgi:2'-hydroxyisoflavone reductase